MPSIAKDNVTPNYVTTCPNNSSGQGQQSKELVYNHRACIVGQFISSVLLIKRKMSIRCQLAFECPPEMAEKIDLCLTA